MDIESLIPHVPPSCVQQCYFPKLVDNHIVDIESFCPYARKKMITKIAFQSKLNILDIGIFIYEIMMCIRGFNINVCKMLKYVFKPRVTEETPTNGYTCYICGKVF